MANITLSFRSEVLERTVPLRALVPLEDAPRTPMPALYLLHGLYGSEQDWFQYTRVMLWARAKGLAVFCPAGENAFYVRQADTGEDYLRYVGQELPAFTRKMFPLSCRRENTFIAGLSMGGYGALNAAFTYPDTFGKAAAFSAALRPWKRMDKPGGGCVQRPEYAQALFGGQPEQWDTVTLARRCGAQAPELWLSCGAQDDLLGENIALVDSLRQAEIPAYFDQPPGDHTWDFWDREMQRAIDWMLP